MASTGEAATGNAAAAPAAAIICRRVTGCAVVRPFFMDAVNGSSESPAGGRTGSSPAPAIRRASRPYQL